VIGAKLARDFHVARADHGGHLGIERLCNLQRKGPDTARCTVNQDFPAGVDFTCAQPL
jgi:hypothetical protein